MSASVSVTVSSSRANTARWTSSTARRNSARNASLPTMPDTADAMIGRAASRSASLCSTS